MRPPACARRLQRRRRWPFPGTWRPSSCRGNRQSPPSFARRYRSCRAWPAGRPRTCRFLCEVCSHARLARTPVRAKRMRGACFSRTACGREFWLAFRDGAGLMVGLSMFLLAKPWNASACPAGAFSAFSAMAMPPRCWALRVDTEPPRRGLSLRGFCAGFRVICACFRVSFRFFTRGRGGANLA